MGIIALNSKCAPFTSTVMISSPSLLVEHILDLVHQALVGTLFFLWLLMNLVACAASSIMVVFVLGFSHRSLWNNLCIAYWGSIDAISVDIACAASSS